jgi:hypothetical protein
LARSRLDGVAQRKTLTEKQVELLRWVADGCSDGVFEDNLHRISAAALRSRGLITVSGRGPTWRAKIAADGRDYLKSVDGPNPPIPRQANVSVTQQLVDQVVAAGGTLRVPRKRWNDSAAAPATRRPALASGSSMRTVNSSRRSRNSFRTAVASPRTANSKPATS